MRRQIKKIDTKNSPSPNPGDIISFYDQNQRERAGICIKTYKTRCKIRLWNKREIFIYRDQIKKKKEN